MAKIRIKQGPNEIEIDSRDFYVDNDSAAEVIESLKQLLNERSQPDVMGSLEDAEFHEPEFSSPSTIAVDDIKHKLRILEKTLSSINQRPLEKQLHKCQSTVGQQVHLMYQLH